MTNHQVIRISSISGQDVCTICGQPAERTKVDGEEVLQHKKPKPVENLAMPIEEFKEKYVIPAYKQALEEQAEEVPNESTIDDKPAA